MWSVILCFRNLNMFFSFTVGLNCFKRDQRIIRSYIHNWASLVAQMVKNLPAMQEIRIQSLGQKDPLEKGMATHSSVLAWKIPRTEKTGGLQSVESQRVRHNWATEHGGEWKESFLYNFTNKI